jgi:Kdo2-lipid IVA lauroyltransferase/acyltransferase
MPVARKIRVSLEAPVARLGLAVVPRLPRRAVLGLARALGSGAYWFSARNRRLGLANLDLAFGDTKSAAEKRRILRESMRSFALVILDLFWFSRNPIARMERWLEVTPDLRAALSKPGARVGVQGHFGNWELIGRYAATRAVSVMSVAMPLKNPAVDELLRKAREMTGQRIIERQGALRKLVKFLREGGTVGLVLDQNTAPEEGGVFAQFFGLPVAVSPAAGLLASMTGAEIIFPHVLPRPDGTYLGELPHVITMENLAAMDRESLAGKITQQITGYYEEAIRARPECWLWAYKRWRHIPKGMSVEGFPYYAKQQGD